MPVTPDNPVNTICAAAPLPETTCGPPVVGPRIKAVSVAPGGELAGAPFVTSVQLALSLYAPLPRFHSNVAPAGRLAIASD